MSSTRATTAIARNEIFDEICEAITRQRGGTEVYLKAAHVLRRDVGGCSLVGLEVGAGRAIYHWTAGQEFASAAVFDETGVDGTNAELLVRGESAVPTLAELEYEWVHPDYRELVG